MKAEHRPSEVNRGMDPETAIERIQGDVRDRFERSDRVLSLGQFLDEFFRSPAHHLRTASQYVLEMFDHFGTRKSARIGQEAERFCLFDLDSGGDAHLVGQERAQNELYQYLKSFARRGKADKMLLLHGPNGSGKTTVVESIFRGLEIFSKTPEGALYTFNWIFTEREGKLERIGFEPGWEEESTEIGTYADLDRKDISARFSCELKDSPLFLIPKEQRAKIIEEALRRHPSTDYPDLRYDHYLEGNLCQKCRKIYDSLLLAYHGDWKKLIRHVQVERFYISKRYRHGAVSIEPQGNIDAGVRPILSEHSWIIPPMLRNISLYEALGDIIDANRGVLEYSDFLKRPIETSKYLLTTCERGTVHLGSCLVYLDLLILGTANEKQLCLFKRSPDFSSFKGRIELIPVPYLLRYSIEAELYRRHIRSYSRDRHVTPHASKVAALWAVLTRLKKPQPSSYEAPLRSIVAELTPIEKARLYDSGEAPDRLSEDKKKLLRSSILKIRQEFEEAEGEFEGLYGAEYEGRRGVSAREMMTTMARAAEARTYKCLTPMAVFDAVEELLKDTSVYDFLRLPADSGYQDMSKLLEDVRAEYFRWVTDEVYDSISLIDETEYDRIFLEYFRHVKSFDAKEQVFKASTGSYEPPNEELMESIEKQARITEAPAVWRSNVITRIAAWSLDHEDQEIDYHRLFPEIYRALRENFYRERNRILTLIEKDILKYGTDEFQLLTPAEQKQVEEALAKMKSKYRYCDECARDVIAYVLRYRTKTEETREAGRLQAAERSA